MIPRRHAGVYVLTLVLPTPRTIRVGNLGRHRFPAGLYVYVGSARRNLDARLARHRARRKRLRWHIDYLTTRAHVVGAAVVPWARGRECLVARRFLAMADVRVVAPRFGSSDCRCTTHLVWVSRERYG